MNILIPLLSKTETSPEFVTKAVHKATQVTLVIVIDTKSMVGEFGFAAGEIGLGNAFIEEMQAAVKAKNKKCETIVEWGNTTQKIINMAKLKQMDKVVLKKQPNQFFEDLVAELKAEKVPIEII
jgi:hypothetical protein